MRRSAATFCAFVVAGWVVKVGREEGGESGRGEGGGVAIGVGVELTLERWMLARRVERKAIIDRTESMISESSKFQPAAGR